MRPAFGGIDFGTSNSTVGLIENGRPRLAPLEDGNVTLPSAVFFNFEDNQTYLGRRAISDYTDGAEGRLMRALKSVLGSSLVNEKTRIKARSIAFTDIIGLFIAHLKDRLEAQAGGAVDSVVLGRPVQFVDDDAEADAKAEGELEKAARAQGFQHIAFQFEPIAAALDYEQTVAREELALIIDMGGGTSDFSIVRVSPQRAGAADRKDDILANRGIHIGGTDFDRLLSVAHVMPRTGLFDAHQGRQAQSARRLFHRPGDLAAHQHALYGQGQERSAADPLRGGAPRSCRPHDRDRRPPLRARTGDDRREGEDRADGASRDKHRCGAVGGALQRRADPRQPGNDDRNRRRTHHHDGRADASGRRAEA